MCYPTLGTCISWTFIVFKPLQKINDIWNKNTDNFGNVICKLQMFLGVWWKFFAAYHLIKQACICVFWYCQNENRFLKFAEFHFPTAMVSSVRQLLSHELITHLQCFWQRTTDKQIILPKEWGNIKIYISLQKGKWLFYLPGYQMLSHS